MTSSLIKYDCFITFHPVMITKIKQNKIMREMYDEKNVNFNFVVRNDLIL